MLLGPRQSGKTTLARSLFPDFRYLSLEDPDLRQRALSDPRGLLGESNESLILDEVQRAPDLLSYLQAMLDDPLSERRFILTGSQNLLLAEKVSQTLAGRTRIFSFLPLSQRELVSNGVCLEDRLYRGGHPRLYDQGLDPTEWLAQYSATYVERDVRSLSAITNLEASCVTCCASPRQSRFFLIRCRAPSLKIGWSPNASRRSQTRARRRPFTSGETPRAMKSTWSLTEGPCSNRSRSSPLQADVGADRCFGEQRFVQLGDGFGHTARRLFG